jgi:hypothetical protein
MLSDLKSHVTNFVNGTQPKFGFRHFDGGPPQGDDSGPPGPGAALGI